MDASNFRQTPVLGSDLSLDWRPSLERLEADLETAKESGRFDPWALTEAECWLDLVDAELVAHQAPQPDLRSADAGVLQLKDWRRRLVTVIVGLRRLEREKLGPQHPTPGASMTYPYADGVHATEAA